MYAAISADIVSSTSLCIEETIALKQRIEDLFSILEKRFPGFWGRLIKGDYMECLLPSTKDGFRAALIIKSCIKSFPIAESKRKKVSAGKDLKVFSWFQSYTGSVNYHLERPDQYCEQFVKEVCLP